jgi:hypothetical protein
VGGGQERRIDRDFGFGVLSATVATAIVDAGLEASTCSTGARACEGGEAGAAAAALVALRSTDAADGVDNFPNNSVLNALRSAISALTTTTATLTGIRTRELFNAVLTSFCNACLIPSKEVVAEEVVRVMRQPVVVEEGSGLLAKSLEQCKSERACVAYVGFEYTDIDGEPIIVCPMCQDAESTRCYFTMGRPVYVIRKVIVAHIESDTHKRACKAKATVEDHKVRHREVGLNFGRLVMQTLREGTAYDQFESKVLDFYLSGGNVGTMNHSCRFITDFVPCLHKVAMERIATYLHRIDPATRRHQVFAINADKATELHRTGQAIGAITLVEGELKPIFYDYVLVKGHTGDSLVHDVLDISLMRDLNFTKEQLRQQFTCFAADGQYFVLNFANILARELNADEDCGRLDLDSPEVIKTM